MFPSSGKKSQLLYCTVFCDMTPCRLVKWRYPQIMTFIYSLLCDDNYRTVQKVQTQVSVLSVLQANFLALFLTPSICSFLSHYLQPILNRFIVSQSTQRRPQYPIECRALLFSIVSSCFGCPVFENRSKEIKIFWKSFETQADLVQINTITINRYNVLVEWTGTDQEHTQGGGCRVAAPQTPQNRN